MRYVFLILTVALVGACSKKQPAPESVQNNHFSQAAHSDFKGILSKDEKLEKNIEGKAFKTVPALLQQRQEPKKTVTEKAPVTPVNEIDFLLREKADIINKGTVAASAGKLQIGIKFQENVDIDLYGFAKKRSYRTNGVSFSSKEKSFGHYLHDYTSGSGENYEIVNYSGSVSLDVAEAYINYYSGYKSGSVQVIVRIMYNQRVYEKKVNFSAGLSGNIAKDFHEHPQVPQWIRLNIKDIVHSAHRVQSKN